MPEPVHTVAEMAAFFRSPESVALRAKVNEIGARLNVGTREERKATKAEYVAALNAIRDALSARKSAQ